jgi:hypothetical protein
MQQVFTAILVALLAWPTLGVGQTIGEFSIEYYGKWKLRDLQCRVMRNCFERNCRGGYFVFEKFRLGNSSTSTPALAAACADGDEQ